MAPEVSEKEDTKGAPITIKIIGSFRRLRRGVLRVFLNPIVNKIPDAFRKGLVLACYSLTTCTLLNTINAMTQGDNVLTMKFERGGLLLQTPHQALIQKISKNISISYDPRVAAWRCDALYYTAVRREVLKSGCRLVDNVSKRRGVKWPEPALPETTA